jgi:hypothetical protein
MVILMKKLILLSSLLVFTLFLFSCAPAEQNGDADALVGAAYTTVSPLMKGDTFIIPVSLSGSPGSLGEILEYKGSDSNAKTSPKIKFKVWSTGETLEYSVTRSGVVTLRLGGKDFVVELQTPDRDNSHIKIDFDGDGSLDDSHKIVRTHYKEGSIIVSAQAEEPEIVELSCGTEVRDEDSFMLGGTSFKYKSSDSLSKTNPLVRFSNLADGGVYETVPELRVIFRISEGLEKYNFKSMSDYNQDDYTIKLVAPSCGNGLPCEELSVGDNFSLGETRFEYMSADSLVKRNPLIRFKNLDTGQTYETVHDLKVIFRVNNLGTRFHFKSESDYNQDDYNIEKYYPCS